MSKLTVITKIARQVEGEYVLVNILGAFRKKENVQEFLSKQKPSFSEVIDDIAYVVEIGIIEDVEILDDEEG